MGDHAAIIFYPLALLYKIYPDVHWLFAVQAIALTVGGFPLYHLSLKSGLNRHQATTIVIAYLLYPLVLNKVLFDFHPEAIAIPGFLTAVLAARTNKVALFCAAIILILSCKSVLSLTVISMGLAAKAHCSTKLLRSIQISVSGSPFRWVKLEHKPKHPARRASRTEPLNPRLPSCLSRRLPARAVGQVGPVGLASRDPDGRGANNGAAHNRRLTRPVGEKHPANGGGPDEVQEFDRLRGRNIRHLERPGDAIVAQDPQKTREQQHHVVCALSAGLQRQDDRARLPCCCEYHPQ